MTAPASLGELEQLLLLVVLRLGDEAYTLPIRDELRRLARRTVARGALYTTLERLEDKGLVSSRMGEPRAERGGRPRRYYGVTARGLSALRSARHVLLRLWQDLPDLERP